MVLSLPAAAHAAQSPRPAGRKAGSDALRVRLAGVFHALSDPTRLRIVEELLNGERCVCNLVALLDTHQPRLSFHLKALKDAGLVADRRDGRWVYYSLVPETLDELRRALETLTAAAREAVSRCCSR